MRMNTKRNSVKPTENTECSVCRGFGYIWREKEEEDDYRHLVSSKCPACDGGRAKDQKERAGIPPLYQNVGQQDFRFDVYKGDIEEAQKLTTDFVDNFAKWKANSLGLYIWSNIKGTGKTMLTCCLANALIDRYGISVRFTTVPDYLEELKNAFKKQPEENDHSVQYRTCDLLILDDLGAEKLGPWNDQKLFELINHRYVRGKQIIVTANMSLNDIKENARIMDRLYAMTVPIHLPEEPIRARVGRERKADFVSNILKK